MKTSPFRIVPLPTEVADQARRTAATGASDHQAIVADSPHGYPCRHCLRFAQPGERVILFPYASIPAGHPYSETGPILFMRSPASAMLRQMNFRPSYETGAQYVRTTQTST